MIRSNSFLLFFTTCLFAWTALPLNGQEALGQADTAANKPVASQNSEEASNEFQIGIAGHVRLGFWTEVSCDASDLPATGQMIIRAADGDGIPVNYQWPLERVQRGEDSIVVGHFRLGQINQRVQIQIVDDAGTVVKNKVLDFENDDTLFLHPATKLLWLELGNSLGTQAVTSSLQRLPDGGLALIQGVEVSKLPVTRRGWESLNRLVANATTSEAATASWPSELSPQTGAALSSWLKDGGRVSIALGPESIQLVQADGALSMWTGGLATEVHSTRKSSSIEFFVGSRSQLLNAESDALAFATFPSTAGADLEIDNRPVIARYATGLGQVDLIGLSLAAEPFASWSSRNNLTAKWLQVEKPSDARLNTTYGYTDLTGQLRSALDQFHRVTLISFTTVAGILIGFLGLVAADYFLMRHVLKKMQLTWVTLPIYGLLACGAVAWLFNNTKSQEVLSNQAEVVDIDAISSQVQGRFWTNVYSPAASNQDLIVNTNNELKIPVDSSEIGWNGLAGTGMGGMMSTKLSIGSDRPYTVSQRDTTNAETSQNPDIQKTIEILKMPFDVASTRSLRGRWQGRLEQTIQSRLTKLPGRDRLYGTFTNPFPVELKNCFLINGGWAYQFRTTLPPNATIDVTTQTDHIALSVWLTRRRAISDTASQNQAWDPVEDDLHRVLEMLMFYEIGNGQDYTNLLHQYEPFLDLSQLRSLDRAVFLGRTDEPLTTLQLNGQPINREQFDRSASAVRIVLPVGVRED